MPLNFPDPQPALYKRLLQMLAPCLEINGGLLKSITMQVFPGSGQSTEILISRFKNPSPAGYLSFPTRIKDQTQGILELHDGIVKNLGQTQQFFFAISSDSKADSEIVMAQLDACQNIFENEITDHFVFSAASPIPVPSMWGEGVIKVNGCTPYRSDNGEIHCLINEFDVLMLSACTEVPV